MKYTIVGTEDGSNITVFTGTGKPLVAHSDHPHFEKIVAGAVANDESVIDLFDLAEAAATKFNKLSERVSVANGRLFFDGEEVDNSLAKQVARFIANDEEDYKPLVAFFENVQNNPNEHSRTQLYDWLNAHDFTITTDGLIVGYKGVSFKDEANNVFQSHSVGTAIVNGEVRTGQIEQTIGDVVEMPRNEVAHDPGAACSTGLHVGTYEYAASYARRGAMLEVHVNPRDVVSVPTDASGEKVRVCRYTVVGTLDAAYSEPILDSFNNFEGDEWAYDHLDYSEFEDDLSDEANPAPDETVADLDDEPKNETAVNVGDTFETTDKRRKGTRFTVESIDGDQAVGKSFHKKKPKEALVRKVKLDRLTSYRYKKV